MDSPDTVLEVARERFGIPWLFPMQRLVIGNVLEVAAKDECPPRDEADDDEGEEAPPSRQVVMLPTGAGKSLCFQIPALLLDRPTLVIYPLLALMEDQKRRLEACGIQAVVFRGGQSGAEREAALAELAAGRAKIAIGNPEVLGRSGLLETLAGIGIAHLAIDEAHCVSEWGESFRPAYLEIARIADTLKPRAISAFTATASPSVLDSVTRHLFGNEAWRLVAGNPDRPNISYAVLPTLSREHSLERILAEERRPLIVFASSRRGVERIAGLIQTRRGETDLRFYHAGLEKEEKRAVETWFLSSEKGILVTTCAYGMGVDKKNVRTVVHWELPGSVEAYLQESGRAGRDGDAARALLLAGPDEEERIEARPGDRERTRSEALLVYARSSAGCRRTTLLGLLGAGDDTACSGCDRCDGDAARDYEGAEEILALLRRNPRRFDRSAAIARLRGDPDLDPPRLACAGILASWRREDLARALRALDCQGRIRTRKDWLWKDRLEVSRHRPRARGEAENP
jgi:ATP-dependent DNA helicase RecQ